MSYQQIFKIMSIPRTPSFQQIQLFLYKILSNDIRPSHQNSITMKRLKIGLSLYTKARRNKFIRIYPFILSGLILILNYGCKKEEDIATEEKIGKAEDLLNLSPEYQAGTYRNIDKIFNTRVFKRGDNVFPLPQSAKPLVTVEYSPDGVNTYDIDDFIARNYVAGLLILKDCEIVLERYEQGNNATSKWTSFSVAKSITSILIGMAVHDGKIADINDLVTFYLPQMAGSAYDGVTIRQLLQMSSGVYWNEDYSDPQSEIAAMFQVILNEQAGGHLELLSGLPRVARPGTIFNYSTGETFLEGAVLFAALGGETLSGYLERKIWANMGMEADGYWLLESPDGIETAGANVSMTLRDYGRFGMLLLNNGIINGTPLLPNDWINQASRPAPDAPQCDYGVLYSGYNTTNYPYYYPLGYGYNWWSMPETDWGKWENLNNPEWWGEYSINVSDQAFSNLKGSYLAQGIFGQFIHVNPQENMVTVIWSTWPEAWIDPLEYEVYCFINAATNTLK
ncbi:MAG: class C beta-lactamase-related serine hydrolase [Sphingobacteriia bacterium]|nr:class C beta-lactamase-related serine hydrolase [Sphingobacteriia bacterium]